MLTTRYFLLRAGDPFDRQPAVLTTRTRARCAEALAAAEQAGAALAAALAPEFALHVVCEGAPAVSWFTHVCRRSRRESVGPREFAFTLRGGQATTAEAAQEEPETGPAVTFDEPPLVRPATIQASAMARRPVEAPATPAPLEGARVAARRGRDPERARRRRGQSVRSPRDEASRVPRSGAPEHAPGRAADHGPHRDGPGAGHATASAPAASSASARETARRRRRRRGGRGRRQDPLAA